MTWVLRCSTTGTWNYFFMLYSRLRWLILVDWKLIEIDSGSFFEWIGSHVFLQQRDQFGIWGREPKINEPKIGIWYVQQFLEMTLQTSSIRSFFLPLGFTSIIHYSEVGSCFDTCRIQRLILTALTIEIIQTPCERILKIDSIAIPATRVAD